MYKVWESLERVRVRARSDDLLLSGVPPLDLSGRLRWSVGRLLDDRVIAVLTHSCCLGSFSRPTWFGFDDRVSRVSITNKPLSIRCL